MSILITNRRPRKYKHDWIFIGNDIKVLKCFETNFSGNRISISQHIKFESINQRPFILEWINKQRVANKDSIFWWMTNLAGKNNLGHRFFDDIIRLAAILKWINDNAKNYKDKEILIICEDSFIMEAVFRNAQNVTKTVSYSNLANDYIAIILKGFFNLVRQLHWYCINYLAAKKSRINNGSVPEGKIYIIHQCLDNASFKSEGPIACRYFTVLPKWLESKALKVYRLPWLNNVSLPTKRIYQVLRMSNTFIPEDWMKVSEYFKSFRDAYKCIFSYDMNISYKNIDINTLLIREKLNEFSSAPSKSIFFRYSYAFNAFSKNIQEIVSINFFEMTVPEFVQLIEWPSKSKSIKFKFIGYYHSLVSNDFLSYYLHLYDMNSKAFPDFIITNGELATNLLISRGYDKNRIINGPALRQISSHHNSKAKNQDAILILLSLDINASLEIIMCFLQINSWIAQTLNVNVYVKPHPMLPKEKVLRLLNLKKLPVNWDWFNGEMLEALSISRCCATIATASIYDVLFAGKIAISLKRELSTDWNYADILETQFDSLIAINNSELKNRLLEIYITNRDLYDNEAKLIQETMILSLNETSESSLHAFL